MQQLYGSTLQTLLRAPRATTASVTGLALLLNRGLTYPAASLNMALEHWASASKSSEVQRKICRDSLILNSSQSITENCTPSGMPCITRHLLLCSTMKSWDPSSHQAVCSYSFKGMSFATYLQPFNITNALAALSLGRKALVFLLLLFCFKPYRLPLFFIPISGARTTVASCRLVFS